MISGKLFASITHEQFIFVQSLNMRIAGYFLPKQNKKVKKNIYLLRKIIKNYLKYFFLLPFRECCKLLEIGASECFLEKLL